MVEAIMTMSEDERITLMLVGGETIARAETVYALGHTTLKGHCHYLRPSSPLLIDKLLQHLNQTECGFEEAINLEFLAVIREKILLKRMDWAIRSNHEEV